MARQSCLFIIDDLSCSFFVLHKEYILLIRDRQVMMKSIAYLLALLVILSIIASCGSGGLLGGQKAPAPPVSAPLSMVIFQNGLLVQPHKGGLSVSPVSSQSSSLVIDGQRPVFKEVSRIVLKDQRTMYGLADIMIINSSAGEIKREARVYLLKEIPNTYLIEQKYSSSRTRLIKKDIPLEFSITDAIIQNNPSDLKEGTARVYYGPADNTVYMVEDHINFPAVEGYNKPGRMIFGGVPVNYVWNRYGGVAVGVLTAEPGTFELPLIVSHDKISLGVSYTPDVSLKQQEILSSDVAYRSPVVFVTFSEGDYYEPLDRYTKLFEKMSNKRIQNIDAPSWARESYWKTWGLSKDASGAFTKDQVRQISNELKGLGINWIMLDWGWFTAEGNWLPNPDIFEDESDLKRFIAELKKDGFRVGLWYQPLQIDPSDEYVSENMVQYAVKTKAGGLFLDDDDLALLNPARPIVQEIILNQVNHFADLGVDHIYVDSQVAQLAVPPDYSSETPLAAHKALPKVYEILQRIANQRGLVIEVCPDGRSQTILNLPVQLNNVGDPKNDRQLRAKLKSLKAVNGPHSTIGAYVDHFADNQVSGSFLNIIGTGGQLLTMFSSLDELGRDNWKIWTDFYRTYNLVSGEYINVYDVGFDYPEGHLIKKDRKYYYSFFTHTEGLDICSAVTCDETQLIEVEPSRAKAYSGSIIFRGLEPNKDYTATNFLTKSRRQLRTNSMGEAVLDDVRFEKEVLFVVEPL